MFQTMTEPLPSWLAQALSQPPPSPPPPALTQQQIAQIKLQLVYLHNLRTELLANVHASLFGGAYDRTGVWDSVSNACVELTRIYFRTSDAAEEMDRSIGEAR